VRPERVLAGLAATATAVWVAASLVSARHGLDLTDESFYLASYRWWSTSTLTFSGAQYVVGPLFEAFGYDVPLLRLTKVALLLALHADLGLRLLAWLSRARQQPLPRSTRAWVLASLVATSAAPTIWLPRSPGYNDLTLMGALVLGSTVLALAATAPGQRLPWLRLGLTGAVLVALLLSKWSTAVMIACFLVGVGAWTARHRGLPSLLAVGGVLAGGAAAGAALVQVAMPWPTILDGLAAVNRAVAATSNSPSSLLGLYLTSTTYLFVVAAACVAIVLLPLPALGRWPRVRAAYAHGLVPVLVLLLPYAALGRRPVGGPEDFFAFAVAWTAWSATFLLGLRGRALPRDVPRRSVLPVLGWLAALPWLFGAGTGNELYFLAYCLVGPWLAALIALAVLTAPDSHADRASEEATSTGGAGPQWLDVRRATSLAAAVLAVVALGVSGTAVVPYRSDGTLETTAALHLDGTLTGLLVTPTEAREYADLVAAVGPAEGRRLLVLDEMPGLALVLDLQPLGEVWTSRIDTGRTASGAESVCRSEDLPAPVVVADRELLPSDRAALRACGADVEDYEEVRHRLGSRDLTLLLPPDLGRS
jgi:uncharacterized membrane protein YuzA (DUF378 family)